MLKIHDVAKEPDGPSQPFGSGPFACGRLIPRTGRAILVATELTDRLRVNEGNAEKRLNSGVKRRRLQTFCQLGGAQHESWSSRYENGLWQPPRTKKMPSRRAIECEDGLRQPREKRCDSTERQPVDVERRDFDAGGSGCHRPTRLRRKRGHPSDGAELAEVFTAIGIMAARTTLLLP